LSRSVSNDASEEIKMAKERENFSKTKIEAAQNGGVPVFSFGADDMGKLNPEYFDIAGNKFSAFYDAAHKLIFVLDETHTGHTPNALLVIADRNGRKWDDILTADYGMDLEDIRPKKNNKYQKLDIDYDGLPIYGQLVADYKTGVDIETALGALDEFRAQVGHRLAEQRLTAALREIETATATIEKTNESIAKLRAQIKTLKAKLAKAHSEVGKKPTKESAAKILKIQSQTDNADEKLKRAKLRLRRAEKRKEDAENDAAAAQSVLDTDVLYSDASATNDVLGTDAGGVTFSENQLSQMGFGKTHPTNIKENHTNTTKEIKPKEQEMAEEPQPLFEKDPEIIDEKIAFQPVEFEVPSFVPPAFTEIADEKTSFVERSAPAEQPAPIPTAPEMPAILPTPEPVAEPIVVQPVTNAITPAFAPITADTDSNAPVAAMPTAAMERPYSPATGQATAINHHAGTTKKPVVIYYLMLIILIGLSVLTLWLYQTKLDKSATPDLTATEVAEPMPEPITDDTAFIITEPIEPMIEPVPEPVDYISAEIIEPEIVPEPEYAPDYYVEQPVQESEPALDYAEPTPIPEPVAEPEPVPTQDIAPMAEEVVIAPVAPDESMLLPVQVAATSDKPEYPVHGPDNQANAATQAAGAESAAATLCTSGTAPDENGCCAGEVSRWIESYNGYGCCSAADGECYPPLR
jgi:hypothetical protein